MRSLRINHSAARGIVGESLTPEFVLRYVNALGTYFSQGRVVVCRDPRYSSSMLYSATVSALMSCGCEILDLGVCPTPVAQYYTGRHENICGGISITGGHNNSDWNGLVPFRADGTLFDKYEGGDFMDIFHSGKFNRNDWNRLGGILPVRDAENFYLNGLLKFLDVDVIARRKLTVVVDGCNGSSGPLAVGLLHKLGCNVIPLNCETNGHFPHDPEPRPRNSHQVRSLIRPVKADIGFCLSSDGTRISVVSDIGETVTEEYTYALVADYYLSQGRGGVVVTNICTTRTLDELVSNYGCRVVKTPIGQANIIDAMVWEQGCLGGEGCGTLAVADFQFAYDAFVVIGIILEALSVDGVSCNDLIQKLPRYHLVKKTIRCRPDRQYAAVEAVRQAVIGEQYVDETDGVRIDWNDGWVHVRAASTEPMLRIMGESRTIQRAVERVDALLQVIYKII